jgi:hypothetical protein
MRTIIFLIVLVLSIFCFDSVGNLKGSPEEKVFAIENKEDFVFSKIIDNITFCICFEMREFTNPIFILSLFYPSLPPVLFLVVKGEVFEPP